MLQPFQKLASIMKNLICLEIKKKPLTFSS